MQETNKMSETNLGIVWGPTLIDSQMPPDPTEMSYQSKVVELVITNYAQIFDMDA
jgi:hypothetical protein